jgi:amino acid transporter
MATIEEQAGPPRTELARGALTLFDTISSTLANLAPVEGIFLAITLVVFAMGSMSPWAFLIAGLAILATGNTMSEFSRSIPSAGSFVTFIGVYEFVQPSQPPPANVFWAWILAIVLVAAAATAIVYLRRPAALQRAATAGPEYITQGRMIDGGDRPAGGAR